MIRNHRKSGFTLLEFLLYIAIASITIAVISVYLSQILVFRAKSQTIAEVEQEGTMVMQNITQAIHNSNSINSPAVGSSAASLSLAMSDVNKNPTVYDLSSGVVRIKEGSAATVNLTASSRVTVSNLSFQNLSKSSTPGIIRIQFTVTHINPGNRNEFNYAQNFYGSATIKK